VSGPSSISAKHSAKHGVVAMFLQFTFSKDLRFDNNSQAHHFHTVHPQSPRYQHCCFWSFFAQDYQTCSTRTCIANTLVFATQLAFFKTIPAHFPGGGPAHLSFCSLWQSSIWFCGALAKLVNHRWTRLPAVSPNPALGKNNSSLHCGTHPAKVHLIAFHPRWMPESHE
jgi:hypothetical protein